MLQAGEIIIMVIKSTGRLWSNKQLMIQYFLPILKSHADFFVVSGN
jgi:hypothetical protein